MNNWHLAELVTGWPSFIIIIMDYKPPSTVSPESEKQFILKELFYRLLGSFIPDEILRDGLDDRTRMLLCDVALAVAIIACILLPDRICFRVRNKRELGLQEAALAELAEDDAMLQWSREEIEELAASNRLHRRKLR